VAWSALLLGLGGAVEPPGPASAAAADSPAAARAAAPAEPRQGVIIDLQGVIQPLSGALLQRKFREAQQRDVDVIVIRIDSPGGYLSTTMELVQMLERADDVETVAFIEHEAISGAALTALAADRIVMHPDAKLGDAGVIVEGEDSAFRYAPEKVRSSLVQQVRTIAETAGRPPALAEAMVDKDISVVEVTDPETGERRFLTNHEWEAVRDQAAWGEPRPVIEAKPNTFLTVNGRRAVELGLAASNVADTEELAERLAVEGDLVVLRQSGADTLILILNNPFVTGLLLFLGLMALLFELSAPGIGIGGLLSIFCFGLFFWSRFLGGTAGWLEVVLFAMGLIFIGMEVFVIPGFGVAGLGGTVMLIASLVMASRHVILPESSRDLQQFGTELGTVLVALLAFLIAAIFLSQHLGRVPGLSRLALEPPSLSPVGAGEAGLAGGVAAGGGEPPGWNRVAIGDVGRTLSPLRPSGKAQFGDALVDVSTEGDFVDHDQPIRVWKRQGVRVIVRKLE